MIGLTSNQCEAQGVILGAGKKRQHSRKGNGSLEILFRTRKGLEFCLLEVVSFFFFLTEFHIAQIGP